MAFYAVPLIVVWTVYLGMRKKVDARSRSTQAEAKEAGLTKSAIATSLDRSLVKGAELDRRTAAGNTALMLAAKGGLSDVVSGLLQLGASADLRNEQGFTALMLASAAGHGEVIKALLQAGADRGLRNKRRQTAIDIAKASGQTAVAELLK